MEPRPSRIELIKLLIDDRNHHFSHPHEVSVKFMYSFGGTITTILIAFFVKGNIIGFIKFLEGENDLCFLVISSVVILIGYMVIYWGISEHSTLHKNQRKRLEKAINELIAADPKTYNFDDFWKKFGKTKLQYSKSKKSSEATALIVAEPDARKWLHYHDRKIELGAMIILLGVSGILYTLFF